jgi:hypothetical protein
MPHFLCQRKRNSVPGPFETEQGVLRLHAGRSKTECESHAVMKFSTKNQWSTSRPEQLCKSVRQELSNYVVPSTQHDLPLYQTSYSRQRGLTGVCQLRPVKLVTMVLWGQDGFTTCSHTSNQSHSMTTARMLSPLYTMEERLRCTPVISYHRWLLVNNLASS